MRNCICLTRVRCAVEISGVAVDHRRSDRAVMPSKPLAYVTLTVCAAE
ncbi:MAG: hypothetical protein JWN97_2905 [Nocardioides sp.]|nr:hypothetical protein [Nocardioides sp.]